MIKKSVFIISAIIFIYLIYGMVSTKHSVSQGVKISKFKSDFNNSFYKFRAIESDSCLKLIGLQYFIEIPTYSCKSCKKIFNFINQQKVDCHINIITSCKSNYIYNQLKRLQTIYSGNFHIYISRKLSVLNSQIFSNGVLLFRTNNNTIDYISILKKYKKEEIKKQLLLLCAEKVSN